MVKKKAVGKRLVFGFTLEAVLLALLAASVGLYVLTQSIVFAFTSFALLVGVFLADFSLEKSMKQNAIDLGIAVGLALGVWLALSFALQTDSPINVVTSCSMLPNLQRGDLVFIQGGAINAPEFSVSPSELSQIKVHKTVCTRAGSPVSCTDAVVIGNRTIPASLSNDVIVFDPKPTGPGLLIHRSFARLVSGDQIYYLTKGDNNPVLDQEGSRFSLVSSKDVKGKVLLSIPYVGYLKLFLFMQFEVPAGCDSTLEYP